MTDENDNVKTMVSSLADGDNVTAQSAFKDALTDKIGQALDDKRQTVANDWLNASDELEAVQDASGLDDAQDNFDAVAAVVDAEVDSEVQTEPFEIDDDQVEEK